MAQRTVALCNGKYIGIESIYTVINGQQINIPEKLTDLRSKSKNNELFCPCGCGTNLILVAGDKNLREQHFREKKGTGKYECTMPIEGKISIDSKIVLKCWLEDKLQTTDIESRVPIDFVEDTNRKPEFSFLSMKKKIGLRYWKTRANILADRLDVLSENMVGIKVLYIVDSDNGGTEGQYPEALMKIQNKQSYCLLLEIHGSEYDKARMQAVFYAKDLDGFWTEITFADDLLSTYNISDTQKLLYKETEIEILLQHARTKFNEKQEREKEKRAERERIRKEQEIKRQEEFRRQQAERDRAREEALRNAELKRQEAERLEKERRQQEEFIRKAREKQEQERKEQERLIRKAKKQNEIDEYFKLNPKVKELFEYFQYNTCLSGVALCRQTKGATVNRKFEFSDMRASIEPKKEYISLEEGIGNSVYVFWNNNPEHNILKINAYRYVELDELSDNYISEFILRSKRQ